MMSRMPWPYGRRELRPRVYPAAAGTWRAAPGGLRKLVRPATVPVEAYSGRTSLPIGIDGQVQGNIGGGVATLFAGPAGLGTTWALDQAGFGTSAGAADSATAQVYAGPQATSPYLVATSYAAGGDAVGLAGIVLQPGEFVWVIWTGSSGVTAQLKISGTKSVLVA